MMVLFRLGDFEGHRDGREKRARHIRGDIEHQAINTRRGGGSEGINAAIQIARLPRPTSRQPCPVMNMSSSTATRLAGWPVDVSTIWVLIILLIYRYADLADASDVFDVNRWVVV